MSRIIPILLFSIHFASICYSQKKAPTQQNPFTAVDKLMSRKNDSAFTLIGLSNFIETSFTKEEDKVRAIFYWITQNISYSYDLMYTYKKDNNRTQLVKDVFENKKGVCIGYAVIFDTLCKLSHLNSFIVEGSTKQAFLPAIIGHAWNAVKLNDSWQLVDATWGSGYLQGKKFIKQRKDFYFQTQPEKLIATHLPIDPIWQLLTHPINLYQFHTQSKSTQSSDWNYSDSINTYLSSTTIERTKAIIRRLNAFGYESEITSSYYTYLKSQESFYYLGLFNKGVSNYNEAVFLYNDYVEYRNKQFTPTKSDEDISKMLPEVLSYIEKSESYCNIVAKEINNNDYQSEAEKNLKQSKELKEKVESEINFVNRYLSTKKSKRRDLFYTKTYTLFGIPIK